MAAACTTAAPPPMPALFHCARPPAAVEPFKAALSSHRCSRAPSVAVSPSLFARFFAVLCAVPPLPCRRGSPPSPLLAAGWARLLDLRDAPLAPRDHSLDTMRRLCPPRCRTPADLVVPHRIFGLLGCPPPSQKPRAIAASIDALRDRAAAGDKTLSRRCAAHSRPRWSHAPLAIPRFAAGRRPPRARGVAAGRDLPDPPSSHLSLSLSLFSPLFLSLRSLFPLFLSLFLPQEGNQCVLDLRPN
ncbi:hypothetical protein Scep_004212 [Stephania cephalantha]|uniref:Uncharacterized protein n=1 Tax=Stephania cephalantha TaxID=152367 RepID=A0AAP0KTH9_9MAGN